MLHDHSAFTGKGHGLENGCPVERLGRELRVLHEIQDDCHALQLEAVGHEVADRMFAISEEASHQQAKSLSGVLFQVAVANGMVDDLSELATKLAEGASLDEEKRRRVNYDIEHAMRAAHRCLWSAAVHLINQCGSDEVAASTFFLGGMTDFREVVAKRMAGLSSGPFRELHSERRYQSTQEQMQVEADALAAAARPVHPRFLEAAE